MKWQWRKVLEAPVNSCRGSQRREKRYDAVQARISERREAGTGCGGVPRGKRRSQDQFEKGEKTEHGYCCGFAKSPPSHLHSGPGGRALWRKYPDSAKIDRSSVPFSQRAMNPRFDELLNSDPQPAHTPRLRVVESQLEDVEQGRVRIHGAVMAACGLTPGEVVLLEGERKTLARVWPLPPDELRRTVIALDGLLRENAGIALNERIRIAAHPAAPLSTLLLAPQERVSLGAEEVTRIRQHLIGRVVCQGDRVHVPLLSRRPTRFTVTSHEPEAEAGVCTPYTDVRIQEQTRPPVVTLHTVKYEDVGGLEEELGRIREMVELPLKYPQLFARLRIEPPKGVLLYGPPGTGKTTIARAVASEVKAHFIRVNGPEIIHKFYGESEAKLREIFEEAQRKAPSIIFIDEIDAVAPRRDQVTGEVEKRVVAQLLALMDGLVSRGEVVVIGATNLPEMLDHALRRPGRFDREVSVRVPSRLGRLQILRIHARGMPLDGDVNLERLAEITHGFVGADLEVLCKEAGMHALQEVLHREDLAELEVNALAEQTRVFMRHFMEALKGIEPTATREFFAERPNLSFADVGGLASARALLTAVVNLPRHHPRLFQRAGMGRAGGVLVTGASGTGKTLLVRALASESGLNFITVDAAALFSKWVGESEKALRQVFTKAKQASPCIVFFDELDTLFPRRDLAQDAPGRERLLGQLIAELDRVDSVSDVMVIGATSRMEWVEPALLSPGRFGMVVPLALPEAQEREEILALHLRGRPLAPDVDLTRVARAAGGLTGADLARVCQRAALDRLQSFIAEHGVHAEDRTGDFLLRQADLDAALDSVRNTLPRGGMASEGGAP